MHQPLSAFVLRKRPPRIPWRHDQAVPVTGLSCADDTCLRKRPVCLRWPRAFHDAPQGEIAWCLLQACMFHFNLLEMLLFFYTVNIPYFVWQLTFWTTGLCKIGCHARNILLCHNQVSHAENYYKNSVCLFIDDFVTVREGFSSQKELSAALYVKTIEG